MATSDEYEVVVMDVQSQISLTTHAMKEERVRCLEAGYIDELIEMIKKYTL